MIEPFVERQVAYEEGRSLISYGLSSYGYDLRVPMSQGPLPMSIAPWLIPRSLTRNLCRYPDRCLHRAPNSFALARSVEYFRIPRDVLTICVGKSTYARCGNHCECDSV